MSIDNIISKYIQTSNDTNLSLTYSDKNKRKTNHKIIKSLVNEYIPKIQNSHDKNLEKDLKQKGYTIIENFLNDDEVNIFLKDLIDAPGFNYHISRNSYNRETRTIDKMDDWNILSYEPDILLNNKIFLQKITDCNILSLVQSYLGCFPTLYSVNSFVSKFTGQNFKIQEKHRDFDDYKFLTVFIYLTDVNSNNGPHLYYEKTHNGSENTRFPVELCGKKGTALIVDGYGYHQGKPLIEGQRIILWFRFGLNLNKTYYKTEYESFKMKSEFVFDSIKENIYNKYLLRGFISDLNI